MSDFVSELDAVFDFNIREEVEPINEGFGDLINKAKVLLSPDNIDKVKKYLVGVVEKKFGTSDPDEIIQNIAGKVVEGKLSLDEIKKAAQNVVEVKSGITEDVVSENVDLSSVADIIKMFFTFGSVGLITLTYIYLWLVHDMGPKDILQSIINKVIELRKK